MGQMGDALATYTTQAQMSSFFIDKMGIVSIKSFGAKADGVTDDSIAIQAAIDYVHNTTIAKGAVFIPPGSCYIGQALTTYSNVVIYGIYDASRVFTDEDIEMFIVSNGSEYAKITDLFLQNTHSGMTKAHIRAINPDKLKLLRLQIRGTVAGTGGGIIVDDGAGGFATGRYLLEIGNCILSHASIEIHQTDAKLYKNWIWAENRVDAIYLAPGCANISIDDCDYIPGPTGAGVHAVQCQHVKVMGGLLDGLNVASIDTGRGIFFDRTNYSSVIGASAFWMKRDAIVLQDTIHNTIMGNNFLNGNKSDNSYSDVVISGVTLAPNGNIVTGNSHKIYEARTNLGYCIKEVNGGAQPTNNIISLNTRSGANYASPSFLIDRANSTTVLRDNVAGIVSNRSGSTVVTTGVTVFIVSWYGLDFQTLPKANEIIVNFTGNLPPAWYISDVAVNSFKLHFASATPAGLQAEWRVSIQ